MKGVCPLRYLYYATAGGVESWPSSAPGAAGGTPGSVDGGIDGSLGAEAGSDAGSGAVGIGAAGGTPGSVDGGVIGAGSALGAFGSMFNILLLFDDYYLTLKFFVNNCKFLACSVGERNKSYTQACSCVARSA